MRAARTEMPGFWLHIVRFAVMAGLYLLLAQSADKAEIAVSIGAALVAVIGLAALSRHNDVPFRFKPRWLKAMAPVPRGILRDSILILGSLPAMARTNRPGFGRFESKAAAIDEAEMPGWRAFKVVEISLAPNSYVVDIEGESGRIVIHQLVEGSLLPRRPGLP